jgi:hypothetical protein
MTHAVGVVLTASASEHYGGSQRDAVVLNGRADEGAGRVAEGHNRQVVGFT